MASERPPGKRPVIPAGTKPATAAYLLQPWARRNLCNACRLCGEWKLWKGQVACLLSSRLSTRRTSVFHNCSLYGCHLIPTARAGGASTPTRGGRSRSRGRYWPARCDIASRVNNPVAPSLRVPSHFPLRRQTGAATVRHRPVGVQRSVRRDRGRDRGRARHDHRPAGRARQLTAGRPDDRDIARRTEVGGAVTSKPHERSSTMNGNGWDEATNGWAQTVWTTTHDGR